jgi:hypothetical protein
MRKTVIASVGDGKVQAYWKSLAKEYSTTLDKVERAWRNTAVELFHKGIHPENPKYNAELMLGTRAKLK